MSLSPSTTLASQPAPAPDSQGPRAQSGSSPLSESPRDTGHGMLPLERSNIDPEAFTGMDSVPRGAEEGQMPQIAVVEDTDASFPASNTRVDVSLMLPQAATVIPTLPPFSSNASSTPSLPPSPSVPCGALPAQSQSSPSSPSANAPENSAPQVDVVETPPILMPRPGVLVSPPPDGYMPHLPQQDDPSQSFSNALSPNVLAAHEATLSIGTWACIALGSPPKLSEFILSERRRLPTASNYGKSGSNYPDPASSELYAWTAATSAAGNLSNKESSEVTLTFDGDGARRPPLLSLDMGGNGSLTSSHGSEAASGLASPAQSGSTDNPFVHFSSSEASETAASNVRSASFLDALERYRAADVARRLTSTSADADVQPAEHQSSESSVIFSSESATGDSLSPYTGSPNPFGSPGTPSELGLSETSERSAGEEPNSHEAGSHNTPSNCAEDGVDVQALDQSE